MRPADLTALLREALTAKASRRKRIAAQLNEIAREAWFDQQSWEAVTKVCGRCDLKSPVWEPLPLGVGEAWLLLYEGVAGVGTVARMCARLDVPGEALLWGPEARAETRGALNGLVAALSAQHKRLPELPFRYHLSAESPTESASVTGSSLGVAACAAVISAALGVPSASTVAATACVTATGDLGRVGFLKEKLDALVRHQPGVKRLVVAESQPLPDGQWPVEFVPCATLAEALRQFELPWEGLPVADVSTFRRYLRCFDLDDEAASAAADWERLADTALATYCVLSNAGVKYRAEAGNALGWWVLFSAHAGRSADLDAFRADFAVLADALAPHVRALVDVFAASALIDQDPARAVEESRVVLEVARGLDRGRETILGRALGTHGRALLHFGRPTLALPFLREAVEEHRRSDTPEVPRSLTYLATATRMAGNSNGALALCEEALDELSDSRRYSWATKTRAYLQLERGRCLSELQRFSEATNAFEEVVRSCEHDHEHPRSGAVRGLAAVHRTLGNHGAAAEYYRRCFSVARDMRCAKTLRQVAAMAVADATVGANQLPAAEEVTVWQTLFDEPLTRDGARTVLLRWVY
jgi:tetratricopeptide (TPR) repeat protein